MAKTLGASLYSDGIKIPFTDRELIKEDKFKMEERPITETSKESNVGSFSDDSQYEKANEPTTYDNATKAVEALSEQPSERKSLPESFAFQPDTSGFSSNDSLHSLEDTGLDEQAYEDIEQTEEQPELPQQQPLPDATRDYLGILKQVENPRPPKGNFMPYKDEGTDSPLGQSIGYGTQIQDGWLGEDPRKWVEIDGVPTDIRKGITEQQASSLLREEVGHVQDALSEQVPHWDKLKSPIQLYFTDLAYNGGRAVLSKNDKALKSLNDKYPVDAMIKTFDFWGHKGEPSRGLFNRRINAFNLAAKKLGVPKVTSYSWGGGKAKVMFESKLWSGVDSYKDKKQASFSSKRISGEEKMYEPQGGIFQ